MKTRLFILLSGFLLFFSSITTAQCPSDLVAVSTFNQGNTTLIFASVDQQASLPVTLVINYGDGSPLDTVLVTSVWQTNHDYPLTPAPFTYLLCVTATDNLGCVSETCLPVVQNSCELMVEFSSENVGDNSVYFEGFVFGGNGPYTYAWDYGDNQGIGGPQSEGLYTYNSPGNYVACLTVTDAFGCSGQTCLDVIVQEELICPDSLFTLFFQVDGSVLTGNIQVNPEVALPLNVSIIYGDGQSQNLFITSVASFNHVYSNQLPSYTLCLVATAGNGCMDTICAPVQVLPCEPIQAVFTHVGQPGNLATFVASTNNENPPYAYFWNFGDGSSSQNGPTVQHSYSNSGSYQVCLTVSDAIGCSETFCSSYVVSCSEIPSNPTPVSMSSSPITTCNALFSDPQGPNLPYLNNQSVTQTFYPASAGAKLRIDFQSFNTEANFDYLSIYNGNSTNAPLIAELDGIQSLPLSFASTASDGSLTFLFATDFTVTAPGWVANIYCDVVSFTSEIVSGQTMLFSAQPDNMLTYAWDFGDGTNGTGLTSEHTYAQGGVYEVCLLATSLEGCSFEVCNTIEVPCVEDLTIAANYSGGNIIQLVIEELNPDFEYFAYVIGQGSQIYQPVSENLTELPVISAGTYEVCVYASGPCNFSSCTSVIIPNDASMTITGTVWNDENSDALQNNSENGLPGSYVLICMGQILSDSLGCIYIEVDENGNYSVDLLPGDYTISVYPPAFFWEQTLPANEFYQITLDENSATVYNFGFVNESITISGLVFYDSNNNGIYDMGELPVSGKLITIGNLTTITDAAGVYTLIVSPGTYTVALLQPGQGYVISVPSAPHTYTINGSTIGQNYGGNNFGLYADPALIDLSAVIVPISTVTPGFPIMNSLRYCNNSPSAQSGSFTYYWDPMFAISSASVFNPQPTEFNAADNSATWNFTDLAPNSCAYIYMNSTAPVTLVLGEPVFNLVMVTPFEDSNPSNNIDTLHQVVVGSWDPNDKQVNPAGIGEEGIIFPNTKLYYTIRFQNTGTAPAVNVVLIDTLTSELVLETFDMIASSHDYTVQIDPLTRVIRWTFSGIMLPDSTSDFEGSIGYVYFSFIPGLNQPDGTRIENFADIYFDFNEPIRTNTALNTVDRGVSVLNTENQPIVSVYPNPFQESTTFILSGAEALPGTVVIYNSVGQVIDSFKLNPGVPHIFEAQMFASGIYFYQIQSGKNNLKGKLIIH